MISFTTRKETDRFACLSVNGHDEFTWCESSERFGDDNLWHTDVAIITLRNGTIVRKLKKSFTEFLEGFFDVAGTIEGKRSGGYRFRYTRFTPGSQSSKQCDILSWGKKESNYRFRSVLTQEGIGAVSQGRKFMCFVEVSRRQWLPDSMSAKAKRAAYAVFDHHGPAVVDLDTGTFKIFEFSNLCPQEVRIHPNESMVAFLGENEVVVVDL